MTTPLVLDALNMAAWTRRHTSLDELICHTDAGSIHLHCLHRAPRRSAPRLRSAPSATASITRWPNRSWGCSRPNCTATPPRSPTTAGPWRGLDDLEIATCAWVSWFNEERLHSELDDRTPAEVEADYRHRSQPDAA
jgi:putative transposase